MGTGTLEIGVNGVVPAVASTEQQRAGYFNTLHGLYGLGAFGFPVLAAWIIGAFMLAQSLCVVGRVPSVRLGGHMAQSRSAPATHRLSHY